MGDVQAGCRKSPEDNQIIILGIAVDHQNSIRDYVKI